MQQVIFSTGKLGLPIGWGILKQGVYIKEGDKYYNLDKKQWTPCSEEDVGTKVSHVPDIIIRKRSGDDTDFNPDKDYKPVVTDDML